MEISLGQLELALLRAKLSVFAEDLCGVEASASPPGNRPAFKPLHHILARKLHPDLEQDPVRRTLREKLMVEVNLAYADQDHARLQSIAEALEGKTDAAREMAALVQSPLNQLRSRVKYAARHQRDLIAEIRPHVRPSHFAEDALHLLSTSITRRLAFPAKSLGELSVRDELDIDAKSRILGPAQNLVRVPFGKSVILRLANTAADLSPLEDLDPEDLNGLIDEWPDFVNLTNAHLRPLARFPRLEELRIGRTAIDGHIFDHFPPLRELRYLALDETAFDDHGMEHLASSAWMQRLDLSSTRITGQGLFALHLMASLRELNLYGTDIGDNDLIVLNSLPTLRNLNLGLTKITDGLARRLGRLQNLEVLHLGGTQISDATIEELPDVRDLTLWETNVTRACLDRLKKMPGLRYLDVDDTDVTLEALDEFRRSRPEVRLPSDIWQKEATA
ncbi:MAG: hypothetical protein KGN84_14840 [Acidobacteriota bacterium]|nr:hypothetical protein [Acidobacteriota bacterium]